MDNFIAGLFIFAALVLAFSLAGYVQVVMP